MTQSTKPGLAALSIAAAVPTILLAASEPATATRLVGATVDNFMLADQTGMGHEEYHFKDMLEVPKGSILVADYVYDNSTANRANPDPNRQVTFGEQTSEEMLFTFARFRFKGETTTERHDEWLSALQANVTFGALDDNIDGKLVAAEFRNDPRFKPIVSYLPMVDADKDGALSRPEMGTALQMLRKMREQRAAPVAPKEDAGAATMRESATGGSK